MDRNRMLFESLAVEMARRSARTLATSTTVISAGHIRRTDDAQLGECSRRCTVFTGPTTAHITTPGVRGFNRQGHGTTATSWQAIGCFAAGVSFDYQAGTLGTCVEVIADLKRSSGIRMSQAVTPRDLDRPNFGAGVFVQQPWRRSVLECPFRGPFDDSNNRTAFGSPRVG